MNRDPKTGQFIGSSSRTSTFIDLDSLPKTNQSLIALYQKHGILPVKRNGIELKLTQMKHGDKNNDNLIFYSPSDRQYPSIRPHMNVDGKLPLVIFHKILYLLLLNVSHRAIASMLGWKYYDGQNKQQYRTKPIMRIRSNNFFVNSFYDNVFIQTGL